MLPTLTRATVPLEELIVAELVLELEKVFEPLVSVVKLLVTVSPYITANDELEKLVTGTVYL